MKKKTKFTLFTILICSCFFISSCSNKTKPQNINNICSIFSEKPHWYKAAKDSEKRWGTPLHIQMAIMHQESSFRSDVRPPRPYIFFVIPWFRNSSAYGYAQAQDATWSEYLNEVDGWFQNRDNFEDSIDFIGWYTHKSTKKNGTPPWSADLQYLNYHEGWGGYRRANYKKKPKLLRVAQKVKQRAIIYQNQLKNCSS